LKLINIRYFFKNTAEKLILQNAFLLKSRG